MKKTLFHCLVVFLLGFGLVIRVFSQTWEWINPLPQGNTLRAVKFIDAGTAVAVGDAATVMRTTDGGETWDIAYKVTGISRSLRGLSFYGQKGIAVGDTGTVITTDDGGLTWERRESGTTRDLLSVSMPDDSLAVAVGYHGIILRSTDGGVTWQQQEIEIGITEDLTAVTFVDSFGVAVGNWGSILLSYDAGVTWLRLEYPGLPWFTDVFFLNQDYGFILELSAGVFRTTDGGENWSLYRLDTEGGLYAIDFYDDSRGMIAGTYGLFMTADSGKTWSPVASGIESTLRGLDVENDGAGIAVGLGGSITTKSYDAENWTPRSQGLTWSLKDLAFVNADTGIAVASNNLVYTFDGGKTWAPLADTVLCCLNAIDFFDENRGTVAGSFRLIYRTDDGGKTWRKQETPLRYNLTFLDVFHVTVDTVYAVGEFGTILATTDGGETWVKQDSGLELDGPALNAVFFTDSRHGLTVSQRAEILRTTDGGQSWSMVERSDEALTDVYFINSDIGVTVGNDGLVLRSTDGGQSWVKVNSGVNWLYSVDFYNDKIGFAVGEKGTILRTDDGGLSWSPEPTNAAEWLHKVFVRDANNIFAIGTRGTILKRAEGVVSVIDFPDESEAKPSFILLQNYPNPFNASTTVSFDVPAAATVTIKVFDVTGKQVGTVYSGHLSEGHHAVNWHVDALASGVYFLRLEFCGINMPRKMTATRKALLLK